MKFALTKTGGVMHLFFAITLYIRQFCYIVSYHRTSYPRSQLPVILLEKLHILIKCVRIAPHGTYKNSENWTIFVKANLNVLLQNSYTKSTEDIIKSTCAHLIYMENILCTQTIFNMSIYLISTCIFSKVLHFSQVISFVFINIKC